MINQINVGVIGTGWCGGIRANACHDNPLVNNLVFQNHDDIDLDAIEVKEGESLEDIKAKLKPKKQAITAEMLDTANTYDDKVAVIRMIVHDESGRVSNVFKNMIQRDMN